MSDSAAGIFVGVIAGLAIGYAVWHADASEGKPPPAVGRYQIIRQNDYLSFVIDTTDGRTWVWSRSADNKVQGWESAPLPYQQ